jgi:vesicle coat complex subunit
MCYDCSPENLVGKIVRGTGAYEFKGVRNTENSFYIVEGVTYRNYGKTYNFTLRCLGTGYESTISRIRRGTFYNHFQHTTEVPEVVYNRIKRNIEYHQDQATYGRKILKRIKKPKVTS